MDDEDYENGYGAGQGTRKNAEKWEKEREGKKKRVKIFWVSASKQ